MEASIHLINEQRRFKFIKAVGTFVPILGVSAAIGFLIVYLATQAWQILAIAGIAILGSIAFLFALWLLRKGNPWKAAMVMIIVGGAFFPAYDFFWSGISPIFILGAIIIPGTIALYGSPPGKKWILTIISSLCAVSLIVAIEYIKPIERLNVTDAVLLRWLVPLFVILGGILALLLALLIVRLSTRLLAAFLIIVLIPVITISVTSTISSMDIDRINATNALDTATTQRESAINAWMWNMETNVFQDNTTRESLLEVLNSTTKYPELWYSEVIDQFIRIKTRNKDFKDIFLMNLAGEVIVSTDIFLEGQNFKDQDFFHPEQTSSFTQPPYFFPPANETSIFFSFPIRDRLGEPVGLVTGRANMRAITQIVNSRTGLGTTGQSLLVDSNYLLLSQTVTGVSTNYIHTDATSIALQTKKNGTVDFTNQDGIPVIGVYHWLPELKAVLITEISNQEAFSGVIATIQINLAIALISTLVAIFGAVLLVRTLSNPINNLADASKQFAAGNFSTRSKVEQEDEIGLLAGTFNNMADQLQGMVTDLEARVAERTKDVERRAVELQVAAEVARDASAAVSLQDLLDGSARLIRERFGFYHVGIFLTDEKKEFAILRAAGGEAGKLMLANNHKLKVGETGMVGYVTLSGEPRVALDTGEDAVYFRNPLLPYTHSEMTLPLKTRDKVIGALDVQSDKANAFDQQDIFTMQIMADQLAVAIEKSRLLEEVEQSALELERSYQDYTAKTWQTFLQGAKLQKGYKYEGLNPVPINTIPLESMQVMMTRKAVVVHPDKKDSGSIIAVPIQVHGLVIGTLRLRFKGQEVSSETLNLVQEAADRLALALENARLVQDAQRLALREKQINLISAQSQQYSDLDTILQNTIRELGNALGVPRAFIQIGLPQTSTEDHN